MLLDWSVGDAVFKVYFSTTFVWVLGGSKHTNAGVFEISERTAATDALCRNVKESLLEN